MKIQLDNKIISSFKLTIDNAILNYGEAFTNSSGLFYPTTGSFYGLNVYSTPYKQLVHDASITGATVVSGLYVSGQFIQPGQSGLVSFNIEEGIAYFSGRPTSVSGVFAIKEFNVYLNDDPEEKILFETKMALKPKYPQTLTGLLPNRQVYPVIFLRPLDVQNIPLCFGGTDNKIFRLRATVLAENQFQLIAVCNILENLGNKNEPLIDVENLPFDAIGGYTGVSYNYTGVINGITDYIYVAKARTSMLAVTRELNQLNPAIYPAFVDFELWNFVAS